MEKTVVAVIAVLTLFSASFAYARNPFLPERKEEQQSSPPLANRFVPPIPSSGAASTPPAPIEEKIAWTVEGEIDGYVVLKNASGAIERVKNGSMFQKCLVQYPDLICGSQLDKMTETLKKDFLREKSEGERLRVLLEKETAARRELEDRVRKLTDSSREANTEKDRLRSELEESKKLKDALTKEKEGIIVELKGKVESLSGEVRQRDEMLHTMAKNISERDHTLKSQEERIKVLSGELQLKEDSLMKSAESLKSKEEEVRTLTLRLEERKPAAAVQAVLAPSAEGRLIQPVQSSLNKPEQATDSVLDVLNEQGSLAYSSDVGEVMLAMHGEQIIVRVERGRQASANAKWKDAIVRQVQDGTYAYYVLDKRLVSINQ